ncbi:MAG: hypothetical protein ACOCRX_08545 [Candidatus Woesearchaeota archaeon]
MTEERKTNTKEFEKLMKYIKKMHDRYTFAIYSFYAWESLQELKAPNVVGQDKAEENLDIIKKYNSFFASAEESLRIHFFLELAKIFDNSNQSLHVDKIINITESNINNLTVEEFKEYNKNQDRAFAKELVEKYKRIEYSDIKDLREIRNKHSDSIEKLKIYRNKWLAHDDIKKPEPPGINPAEIKSLFKIILKILNLISGKLNNEKWMYNHVEDGVKDDTYSIVDNLRKFELYRKKEIRDDLEV